MNFFLHVGGALAKQWSAHHAAQGGRHCAVIGAIETGLSHSLGSCGCTREHRPAGPLAVHPSAGTRDELPYCQGPDAAHLCVGSICHCLGLSCQGLSGVNIPHWLCIRQY